MIRIVYIGKINKNRIKILKDIDNSIIDIITHNNMDDIIKNLPNDVIDLFIVNNLPKICNNIKSIKNLSNIPIISLIDKSNIDFNTDLIILNKTSNIEFLYQVKTLIKMKLIDDELKKEKIMLELKVKDRTNELKNKAEKLRITLESIGDGVVVTDKDGYIISMNPISMNICGILENRTVELKIDDLFNVSINDNKINIFNDTKKMKNLSSNAILKTKDGRELRIRFTTSVIYVKNSFDGIIMVFRDNTQEYYMRKKLVSNEQKYKRIYDNIPDIIFTMDLDGNITSINKLEDYGYKNDEVIGTNINNYIDKNSIKTKDESVKYKLDNPNKITKYEIDFIDKYNNRIPFEIKSLLLDNDGHKEIFGIARNIKDKIENEKNLKDSEKKFRLIFDNSNDPIMVSELTPYGPGNFLLFNEAAVKGTGYSREELYELTPKDINEPDSIEKIENDIQKLFEDGHILSEVIIIKKSGDKLYAENNLHIIDYEGKKSVLSIGRDITQRKLAEFELIKAKEKAEESDKLKTEFISNMTHEIKTPMNSIMGFSEQIKNNPNLSKERLEEYLSIINSSSELLMSLMNNLINLSDINAKTLKIEKNLFDINKMMKESEIEFNNLKNKIDFSNKLKSNIKSQYGKNDRTPLLNNSKKDIEIKLSIKEPIKFELYSDKLKIKQILNNLITNAIKYTEVGSIEYGYYNDNNNYIVFFVRDTGIGIDKDDYNKIFNRFFRVNNFGKEKISGVGLGLTISKSLVELMGGRIWLKSNVDQGSTFYFSIPIEKDIVINEKTNDKKERINKEMKYDWSKFNILILEKDINNFTLKTMMLNATNINITHVDNGIDYFNKLRDNKFNLILLDITVDDIDGFDLLKHTKEKYEDIPIIVQTPYTDKSSLNKLIANGASDYILMPISNFNKLLTIIDNNLSK